ncbi:MAG: tyrosine decarboxylase MfnA [Candidatus Bathyarchaeota archaeon]|nr:tyrosine decarboxylase MfnA [Candidatus Bathyarchaeota archaeon]
MHQKGLPKTLVLQQLKSKLKEDFTYDSGKILGSMCTEPHAFAKQVYMKFLEKNLGDPGLFPATAELEKEAIQLLGSLLSNPNARGHFVSGGTEANIIALWAARNLSREKQNEVIVPFSAHYSFDKAADLLGLKLIRVKLNERFQVDMTAVKEVIKSKTLAIVGVAGTTDLGIVDPIPELSEIAVEHGLYFHVDAAFGGFVLPFFRELGYANFDFDFKLPGVCSITVDPHKMGLVPIPAGGILFRNEAIMKSFSVEVPYLAGGNTEQSTIVGTRSGASALAVWALLTHLGREGYKAVVERCMSLTWKLAEGIERMDEVSLVTEPVMNIVGIKSNDIDINLLTQKLRERGWAVSLFPNHIRIAVMPHIKLLHVQSLLKDLKKIVKETK